MFIIAGISPKIKSLDPTPRRCPTCGLHQAYLKRIGWKSKPNADEILKQKRADILAGLEAAVRGELPTRGPRGGVLWTPRYFVRRVAWHVIDHAWEIEDRIL